MKQWVMICWMIFTLLCHQQKIDIYPCTYRENEKTYMIDLKVLHIFQEDYVCLNDLYQLILLNEGLFEYNENEHFYHYQNERMNMIIDYQKHHIFYEDVDMNTYDYCTYIYISHKNIYLNVSFIEKLIFNNEKEIIFLNKTAIIQ